LTGYFRQQLILLRGNRNVHEDVVRKKNGIRRSYLGLHKMVLIYIFVLPTGKSV
jgi:hypothetical protein